MNSKIRTFCAAAIVTALVYVVTFTISIPVAAINGAYFNIGDIIIYCGAFVLGGPWGALAAGIGSMLADITLGAMIYAPATLVVKACMVIPMILLTRKAANFKRYAIGCLLGAVILCGGYFAYETILYTISASILTLPLNALQGAFGAGVAIALYKPMRAIRVRMGYR